MKWRRKGSVHKGMIATIDRLPRRSGVRKKVEYKGVVRQRNLGVQPVFEDPGCSCCVRSQVMDAEDQERGDVCMWDGIA